jgi:uncharacterized membrane protein
MFLKNRKTKASTNGLASFGWSPGSLREKVLYVSFSVFFFLFLPEKRYLLPRERPALFFSDDEIQSLAKPFQFILIRKFSYGHRLMESLANLFRLLVWRDRCRWVGWMIDVCLYYASLGGGLHWAIAERPMASLWFRYANS